jgi:hypothetical protein
VNRPSTRTYVTVERDAADLRCLAALLDAHRQWESETNSRANTKALREWLWFHWQAEHALRHVRPNGW